MASEDIALTDATLRDNAELRRALDAAMQELDAHREEAARLMDHVTALHDAWKLIGRCDYFLETYAAQPERVQRQMAAKLRAEIKKASEPYGT